MRWRPVMWVRRSLIGCLRKEADQCVQKAPKVIGIAVLLHRPNQWMPSERSLGSPSPNLSAHHSWIFWELREGSSRGDVDNHGRWVGDDLWTQEIATALGTTLLIRPPFPNPFHACTPRDSFKFYMLVILMEIVISIGLTCLARCGFLLSFEKFMP